MWAVVAGGRLRVQLIFRPGGTRSAVQSHTVHSRALARIK